jgi:rod shape-determining protein MreC
VLLVLASLALITLDARSGSPVDPVRDAVGTAVGPVEAGAATAVRPFKEVARSLDNLPDVMVVRAAAI